MRKGPVTVAFLAHVVNDGSMLIIPSFLPFLIQSMHISYVQAGFIWTLVNIAGSIPQPFFGILSDRAGRFGLAAAGLALGVVSFAALGSIDNYYLVLLAVTIGGIGTAVFHPISAAIVSVVSGGKRGAGMSIYTLGGNIGFAAAPLVFPILLLQFGPGASWIILPVGLLAAAALFVYTKDLPYVRPATRAEGSDKSPVPWAPLTILAITVASRSWIYATFAAFLPIYLTTRGISLEDSSRVLSLVLFFGALGGMLGGIISDYFSAKWLTTISLAITTIVLAVALETTGVISVALFTISGLFLLASFPVTIVMAQRILPTRQALASGLMLGFTIGLGGLGGSGTGWLIDNYGMQTAMLSLVALALLGTLFMISYKDKEWHRTYGMESN
ncbi:MAG: MFS transporter [Chloroflexi bacterium]|nr:MFS transporter [Chloroflexota bacterium]